ncbi:2',5'-phosphodiesterase 12 [Epargyreus clarus]|uniref:2',5'-phosphodiesterase 12 n=1 Tax=Epargyreus clarus TaxID=520877 RepID=UPI003C3099A5
MLLRFIGIVRKYSSFVTISKTNMNMDKCYFRHMQNDTIDITFLYKINNAVRQFNLSRKTTDTLKLIFTRMATNIQKVTKKSKGKKEPNEDIEIIIKVLDAQSNTISEEIACSELFSMTDPMKLTIQDQIYNIVFNAPYLQSLSLPKSILAGFPVYPENFVAQYTDKQKSIFNWYKGSALNEKGRDIAEIHIKWTPIITGQKYIPSTDDIGMKLKLECIPANDTLIGPAVEVISKNVVEAGPGHCPFENRHLFTSKKLEGNSFRCVSYNILADLYCDSDFTRTALHPYCPPYALHIDYRKQLIIKELLGYNADIMCLQEVDSKIFNHYLKPILESEVMEGRFYKKGKEVAEGLSCFYRSDRYRFLSENQILLAEALQTQSYLQPVWTAVKANEALKERVLDRSTVASATILRSIDTPNEILVIGNTHLYFHPDSDHIRLIQGGIVIYWLQHLCNTLKEQNKENRISLILCGDFNSVPSCGIYQLYTQGVAPNSLPDWSSNQNEAIDNLTLNQEISLASACGTPEYTNFTEGFADCLDYIFYDTKNLTVAQVIPLPSIEELKANTALPSVVFPSDHIAIVSDLQFK